MSKNSQQILFALVEPFFADFLPQQRGASLHTVRAYRDSLKLLLQFIAQQSRAVQRSIHVCDWSSLRSNSWVNCAMGWEGRIPARQNV
jgi:site-specific recombinase XerC